MARDFGPFPSKPMYEVVNRRMQRALAEAVVSTGFARTGQGAVTAGTGAQLVIAAYPDGALVDGLYVENSASETVTVTTNTGSTNPRIDRLVMRLDMAAETIAPFQIVGTPAASPAAPPLVNTGTVVDMPLVQYRFPGSASAQNPGSIVDERVTAGSSAMITAYRTSVQGIPLGTGTVTAILDAAEPGAAGFTLDSATGAVTVGAGGPVEASAVAAVREPTAGASRLFASVYVNGTEVCRGLDTHRRNGAALDQTGSVIPGRRITLAAGDVVTLRVFHDGPAADLLPGSVVTWMQLRRIA